MSTPIIALRAAAPQDRDTLANLMQLYLYDIAPYAHGGWRDLGPDGRYAYAWLDHYWSEPDRHPFLIQANDDLAGFVLVNAHRLVPAWTPARSIAEFFVLAKYRRRGVGAAAARATFDRFPGRWQVAQDTPNTNAQAFWRAVIDAYTGGAFETRLLADERWHGPVLLFTSPGV